MGENKVTVEEIWKLESLVKTTTSPHEIIAIRILAEEKREIFKEQEWEKYKEKHEEDSKEMWESIIWLEPPVGN